MIVALHPYPPHSGAQQRTMSELEVYSQFLEIDLLTFHDISQPEIPQQVRIHLRPYCRFIESVPIRLFVTRHRMRQIVQFLQSQWTPLPFRVQKFFDERMRQLLLQKLHEEQYDIIHFNHLSTTCYLPFVQNYPARRLCTESNVEWEIFARYATTLRHPLKRLLAAREAKRLYNYEIRTLMQMDGIIALSDRDKNLLQQNGVKVPIHTFRRPLKVVDPPLVQWEQTEPMVISLGRLEETRTHGTLWCAREVWSRVRQAVPDARWHIIGADPPPTVKALHGRDGIQVEGLVEDLTPFQRHARACIIPLFIGGGIRNKILDMLGLGMPCVSTRVGAQGLENEGVWIADDAEGFAQGIVELLTNRTRWEAMQQAGQAFIRTHYAPDVVIAETRLFIERLLEQKK